MENWIKKLKDEITVNPSTYLLEPDEVLGLIREIERLEKIYVMAVEGRRTYRKLYREATTPNP